MVHTATLTYRPTGELFKRFIDLGDTKWIKDEHSWMNTRFKSQGIKVYAYSIERPGNGTVFKCKWFVIRINFKRLVEQQERIVVMTEDDTAAVEEKFNDLMQQLLPDMPLFEKWKVNRIDYCVNVRTPYVEEYIRLMQKGNIPYNMKIPYNKENRNYSWRDGSCYLISKAADKRKKKTGSITINFYDKYNELKKQQLKGDNPEITEEVVEQGRNILRLEVQCHKPKTEYLKVKHGMSGKNIHYFLQGNIGYDVLDRAVQQVCGTASYRRKAVAMEMINELGLQERKKDKMKKLVAAASDSYSSVKKIKELWTKPSENFVMGIATFRNYIHLLEENDINAVTISNNKSLQGKTYKEGLKSVWELFDEAYHDEYYVDEIETDDADDIEDFLEYLEEDQV